MRFSYYLRGYNLDPMWGFTRRQQGRQVRFMLDLGRRWVAVYFWEGRS